MRVVSVISGSAVVASVSTTAVVVGSIEEEVVPAGSDEQDVIPARTDAVSITDTIFNLFIWLFLFFPEIEIDYSKKQ